MPAPRSASSPMRRAGSAGSSPRSPSARRSSITWLLKRGGGAMYCLGLALILGGALGNVWDRLTIGQRHRLPAVSLRALGVAGVQRRRQRDHRRRGAADPRQLPQPRARRPRARRTRGMLMEVAARQSARLLRRRRPRDRDRRAGARAIRRADLRPPRGRPQQVRRRRPEGEGRGVRRRAGRSSRRQHRRVLGARRVEGRARRGRRARARRVRRHVSARHQGPYRSGEDARPRPRDRDDRPRRPSGGRGNDGPVRRRHPSRRVGGRRRASCRSRDPAKLAYVTQTTLSVDDAAGDRRCAEAALPAHRRAEEGRHLLRDAEPAGCREVHGAAGGRRDRRRQPQQLEFEPAARGRGESRRPRVHGRPRR